MGKISSSSFINRDTMIHSTTVYARSSKPKRSFSIVVKGLMISTVLLSNIALGGGYVSAATNAPIFPIINHEYQNTVNIQDEEVLISNLNLAVQVIKESGWSIKALTDLMDSLTAIENRLFDGDGFHSKEELKTVVLETENVVTSYGGDGLPTLRGNGNAILEKTGRIKSKLGNGQVKTKPGLEVR